MQDFPSTQLPGFEEAYMEERERRDLQELDLDKMHLDMPSDSLGHHYASLSDTGAGGSAGYGSTYTSSRPHRREDGPAASSQHQEEHWSQEDTQMLSPTGSAARPPKSRTTSAMPRAQKSSVPEGNPAIPCPGGTNIVEPENGGVKMPLIEHMTELEAEEALASFVAWALPRASSVTDVTLRYTTVRQRQECQVMVGLFKDNMRQLKLEPGQCGNVPLRQATLHLISYCTHMQELEISSDNLMSRNLWPLTTLVDLRDLQLNSHLDEPHSMPEFITCLTRLQRLCLGMCSLTEIQDSIEALQMLHILEIRGANNLFLNPGFSRLSALQDLEFSSCKFRQLIEPEAGASGDGTSSWCPDLRTLTALTSVAFYGPKGLNQHVPTPIQTLPALKRFTYIAVVLKVWKPLLITLPPHMGELAPTMKEFVIEGGQWNITPPEIMQMRRLQGLAIRNSCIGHLTDNLTTLRALRRLDLSGNFNLDINDSIVFPAFPHLKALDLSECKYLKVTMGLTRLTECKQLRLVSLYGCTAESVASQAVLIHTHMQLRSKRPDIKVVVTKRDEVAFEQLVYVTESSPSPREQTSQASEKPSQPASSQDWARSSVDKFDVKAEVDSPLQGLSRMQQQQQKDDAETDRARVGAAQRSLELPPRVPREAGPRRGAAQGSRELPPRAPMEGSPRRGPPRGPPPPSRGMPGGG